MVRRLFTPTTFKIVKEGRKYRRIFIVLSRFLLTLPRLRKEGDKNTSVETTIIYKVRL